MNYCPLNINTCYSFLSSALKIDDIFEMSNAYGYSYFGVNDVNSMFCYSDIVKLSQNYKSAPIYGSSFFVILEN